MRVTYGKGSTKEPTQQIRVPLDIARWLKNPDIIPYLRKLLQTYKHA